jgi:hypothetical protein
MTQDGLYVDPASLRALGVNINRFKREVMLSSHKGLVAYGMRIVARAKEILRDKGNIATGLLRNSGRTVEQGDGTVDAGFYAAYAAYVEYGRKAGGMPPVDDIYQWIRKKRIRPSSGGKGDMATRQRSLAWAIAKHVKRNGTKAHPFLKPAYEQYRMAIDKFMQTKVNEAVDRFKPKQ